MAGAEDLGKWGIAVAMTEEEVDDRDFPADDDLERTPLGRAFLRLRADHQALDARMARIEMGLLSAGAALTVAADARDDC